MIDFVINVNCKGVLIKNLEACMQQGVATLPMVVEALHNANLFTIERCATIPLTFKCPKSIFEIQAYKCS